MSGFTTRLEAEDMIDLLNNQAMFAIGILSDKANIDYMSNA